MSPRQRIYTSGNPKYEALKEFRKKHDTKRIPLDVPLQLYYEFKGIAERRGEKINTILRQAIEDYIRNNGCASFLRSDSAQTDNPDLSRLVNSIVPQRPRPSSIPINNLPPDYEPQFWEESIPPKYWGFATASDLSNYIKANNLSDQFQQDMNAILP